LSERGLGLELLVGALELLLLGLELLGLALQLVRERLGLLEQLLGAHRRGDRVEHDPERLDELLEEVWLTSENARKERAR
jgi:hypothetical protein